MRNDTTSNSSLNVKDYAGILMIRYRYVRISIQNTESVLLWIANSAETPQTKLINK